MKKTKILFLIHDLGHGGAEKVLVNLVNNMDREKFDITVMSLFGGGVNEQFLAHHINYKTVFKKSFRGNSKIMKLFSPQTLHKKFIKEKYDIEVSYLEGPTARIISGCPHMDTKLACWIHTELHTAKVASSSFKSYEESLSCYKKFNNIACVSGFVKKVFSSTYPEINNLEVLFNTNETNQIISLSAEAVEDSLFSEREFKLCGVGKIVSIKGFDRLARIHLKLTKEGFPVHTYILGVGSEQKSIEEFLKENGIEAGFTFLGYQTNPYKYVSKCDLYVCSSFVEGFSTAATEALIVGTPVCTTSVSGMDEMLGENNEWGVITENNEEALYEGIKRLVSDPALLKHYKEKALERRKAFTTEETVKATENFLLSL